MAELTLLRRASELADAACQRRVLEADVGLPPFARTLADHRLDGLHADGVRVLQVNVGKVCNQTCRHCHVDAGPDRRESMSRETAETVIDVLARTNIATLDITGGAPEMNPHFRYLVAEARRLGRRVIDRSNLTILVAPGYEDLADFLAAREVEIVASLPCYLEENVDRQRGDHAFRRSIEALQRLNRLGYGVEGSPRSLTLVYNPLGPALPPNQEQLEVAYRRELRERHGVEFTRLYTITNMPISRFLDDLLHSGAYDDYMRTLVAAFRPANVAGLMCRTTLSVDWQGNLYDCDFNQMLELPVIASAPRRLADFNLPVLAERPIIVGQHCYGCTAGAGSSCEGAIAAGP